MKSTSNINRREALSALATAAVAGSIGAGAPSRARASTRRVPLNPPAKVRVGVISAMFDSLSIIAADRGYFRDEGLDVDLMAFPGSAEAAQALAIGALDVIASGPNPMIFNSRQRNIDLTIVASAGQHSPGHGSISFVLRKDLIDSGRYKSPADLKGLKIASGLAAPSSWMLSQLAKQAGLNETDYQTSPLGISNVVAGMANKSLDGGCINEPHATMLIKKVNGVRILSMDQFRPNFPNGYLLFGAELTKKNQEAGRRYMVAYLRALRDYRAAFFDTSTADTAATRNKLVELFRKHNMELTPDTPILDFPADAAPSFVSIDELVTWHLQTGAMKQRPNLATLADDSFRKYALAQLA